MSKTVEALFKLDACSSAVYMVDSRIKDLERDLTSPLLPEEEIWLTTKRGDWLLWLVAALGVRTRRQCLQYIRKAIKIANARLNIEEHPEIANVWRVAFRTPSKLNLVSLSAIEGLTYEQRCLPVRIRSVLSCRGKQDFADATSLFMEKVAMREVLAQIVRTEVDFQEVWKHFSE